MSQGRMPPLSLPPRTGGEGRAGPRTWSGGRTGVGGGSVVVSGWLFVPAVLVLLLSCPALAQQASHGVQMSPARVFAQEGGAALYAASCAACHMPNGEGAVGAGAYPRLARNANLEAAGYPLTIVMQGLRGMPALGHLMSDRQVADVVNYLRTNFGNDYRDDPVTPGDVAALR